MPLSKYGTIKGGSCDQAHNQRARRETGVNMAVQYMLKKHYLVEHNGWWRIPDMPKYPSFPSKAYFELFGSNGCGDHELGFLRFMQVVVAKLVSEKKAFRWKWLEKWAESIAGFELGVHMDSPLSIITPGEKVEWGLTPPHRDDIYQKKKKDGVFGG